MATSVNLAPNGMQIGQGMLVIGLAADLASKQALTFDANGNLNVNVQVGGGGGGGTVNQGNQGTAAQGWFVEITDGTNVLGTIAHPLNDNIAQVGGTNFALGQQLAAFSLPVVLTAAQLSALTPLSTVAVTQSGTWTVGISAAQTIAVTNAGTFPVQATLAAETTKVIGTVNQGTSPWVVSNSGTFAVQAALNAETTKVIGTVRVLGNAGAIFDAATASAVPANAVQEGLRAATAYPTAVTDGQMVGGMADKAGRAAVVLNTVRDLVGTFSVQSTSASLASLIAAAGANIFTDICELILTNESATATIVSITDGTTTYKFALAGNGGLTKTFATPLKATSANTAWQVSNSAAVNVDCVGVYAKNQ